MSSEVGLRTYIEAYMGATATRKGGESTYQTDTPSYSIHLNRERGNSKFDKAGEIRRVRIIILTISMMGNT